MEYNSARSSLSRRSLFLFDFEHNEIVEAYRIYPTTEEQVIRLTAVCKELKEKIEKEEDVYDPEFVKKIQQRR